MYSKHSILFTALICLALLIAGSLMAPYASAQEPLSAKVMRSNTGTLIRMRQNAASRAAKRLAKLHAAADRQDARVTARASKVSVETFRTEVLKLVNEQRTIIGLQPYTYNKTLEKSAQLYAENMEKLDFFSHVAPSGEKLKDRMHASGYYQKDNRDYEYGENLAFGQQLAKEVMEDWMHSPGHRGAILSPEYKEIGIGKAGKYWVQHFGAINGN